MPYQTVERRAVKLTPLNLKNNSNIQPTTIEKILDLKKKYFYFDPLDKIFYLRQCLLHNMY